MYFDDVQVRGMITSYDQMERIYKWFLTYIQLASAGHNELYNDSPVLMIYHARGWQLEIYPKSLPGFRYGRDVVAPTWALQAAVAEADRGLSQSIIDHHIVSGRDNSFNPFTVSSAEIGFNPDNPFSDPNAGAGKDFKKGQTSGDLGSLADYYNNLIPAYKSGKFESLDANVSGPAAAPSATPKTSPANDSTTQTKTAHKVKQ
jgi:hypothetical protein